MKPKVIVSRRQLRNVAFALSGSVLSFTIVGAVVGTVMSIRRGEGWDWVFLIPITIMLTGILLPSIAGIRIINGGGLAWLTVALCYLGLQIPGGLVAPLY